MVSEKLKIGFDAKRAFHNYRGLGNYGRTLIEGLEKYSTQFQFYLYTPNFRQNEIKFFSDHLGQSRICTPQNFLSKTFHPLWRSFGLPKLFENDGLDLYHGLSHELPFGIDAFKGKKVVTIHDLIYLRYPEFFPWLDRKVYHKKFTYSTQKADIVVAICEQTKRDLIHYFGLDERKIVVLYQACHPRFYDKLSLEQLTEVTARHQIDRRPYILYVGAFEKRKNLINLIHAYAIIAQHMDYDLVLVGNGRSYKQKMIDLIKHYGLEERIHIKNNIAENDLPAFYQASELFVFPSFYEGFGLPIVEALFSEVPVITSEGSCFPESGGPHSQYIDPNNVDQLQSVMREVLSNRDLHQQMKTQGRLFVEKFHLRNTTQNLGDFYCSVINDKLVNS